MCSTGTIYTMVNEFIESSMNVTTLVAQSYINSIKTCMYKIHCDINNYNQKIEINNVFSKSLFYLIEQANIIHSWLKEL